MTSNNSFELHQGDEAWPEALDGLGDVSKLYGVGDLKYSHATFSCCHWST